MLTVYNGAPCSFLQPIYISIEQLQTSSATIIGVSITHVASVQLTVVRLFYSFYNSQVQGTNCMCSTITLVYTSTTNCSGPLQTTYLR